MPRLVDDQNLYEAFRKGEPGALAEVYKHYAPEILELLERGFRFESNGKQALFRGYTEPWQAETALADIFIKAFSVSARQAYDGMRPYRNYLFVIARNFVIDDLRRRKVTLIEFDEAQHKHNSTHQQTDNPHDDVEHRDILAATKKYIDSLAITERQVFHLRFHEGLSIEACAHKLNTSEHFIKACEKRLRKNFFYSMQQQGFFEGYRYGSRGIEKLITMLFILAGVNL
ncbi:MAG: sigma-70 family RNA polymerase sigma factor [Deltaproteobacteria bacterium]|nr:sigma-70 family RNA polymerase sigma factor [Deltaproteobacteria bacterium]